MDMQLIGVKLATGLLAADFGLVGATASAAVPPLIVLALWLVSWRRRGAKRSVRAAADGGRGGAASPEPHPGSPFASSTMLLASLYGMYAACSPAAPARHGSPSPAAPDGQRAPARPSGADAAAVVDFWREAGPGLWFAKDLEFDRRFRERFIGLHGAAARGELDSWMHTPQGSLALLILLDQFPRNAFRGTPRMYATDAQARALADRAIRAGHDRAVGQELRVFMYLPFGHSESLSDQERAVQLCESLGEPTLGRAKHHREIVRRFGRFPHRNPVLGRAMRPEEQKFLDAGGFAG